MGSSLISIYIGQMLMLDNLNKGAPSVLCEKDKLFGDDKIPSF